MTHRNRAIDRAGAFSPEEARLDALHRYDIVGTAPEAGFDRITRLAKLVMDTPIVAITFVDRDRLWFKSSIGLVAREMPRATSFCTRAIEHAVPLIITDALADPALQNNPFLAGPQPVRFYMGVPLRTSDGFNLGTLSIMDWAPRVPMPEQIAVLQDLAGLVVDELDLRHHADTDSLTETMTRRSFTREARRALSQALRHDAPLSCLVVDIDRFKTVNERFGHAAGDVSLRSVSATCQRNLRSMDIFGRLGGKKFGVVLPDASADDAMVIATRVLHELAAARIMIRSGQVKLTASIGVSSRNGRDTTLDVLMGEADAAVLEAKRCGRNRVVIAMGGKLVHPAAELPDSAVAKPLPLSAAHP